jgi:hypothetical protein
MSDETLLPPGHFNLSTNNDPLTNQAAINDTHIDYHSQPLNSVDDDNCESR